MGRADYLELGTHNALCDRCQKKYKANELKKEWTGWIVCESCWEPRHPQEFLEGRPDNENVPFTRPDREDAVYEEKGDVGATLVVGTDESIQVWGTTLTADREVILSTTGAQNGDQFIIFVNDTDSNRFYISSTTPVTETYVPARIVTQYNGSSWFLDDLTPLGL